MPDSDIERAENEGMIKDEIWTPTNDLRWRPIQDKMRAGWVLIQRWHSNHGNYEWKEVPLEKNGENN